MTDHRCDPDELVAWALGNGGLGAIVCAACRAEAMVLRNTVGRLSHTAPAAEPPPALRDRLLTTARQHRPPCDPAFAPDLRRWAEQIAALDAELATLTARQWLARVEKHRTVRAVVAHLAGNDRMVRLDLAVSPHAPAPAGPDHDPPCHLPDPPPAADEPGQTPVAGTPGRGPAAIRAGWRIGAERLLREVGDGTVEVNRPVRLAGRWGAVRPLADALVQRGFETWVHADDTRVALGRPRRTAPAGQVHAIVELGVRLLPGALVATGRDRPDGTVRLKLTGPGGGEWTVSLRPGAMPEASPAATVTGDAAGFCRLMAGRRSVAGYPHRVAGSAAVAADLLATAATLGCD